MKMTRVSDESSGKLLIASWIVRKSPCPDASTTIRTACASDRNPGNATNPTKPTHLIAKQHMI
jgi:hypothetical protein